MRFNGNIVAIDWDRHGVRILLFSRERAGAVRLHQVVAEKLTPGVNLDDAESFGGFLKELLLRHNVRSSGAVFGVGRDKAFLHPLTIPASPEDQVANLVRFQLAQELPFAIEESVVDYVITTRNEEGKVTAVTAAAVRTETLDFLRHLARVAGVSLRRVGLRPYANFLAAREANLLADQLTLLVNLNLQELETDLLSSAAGAGVLFSRSIGLGETKPEAPGAKEQFVEQVTLQLKRTLQAQAYLSGTQTGGKPQQLLVAGSTGWEKELAAQIGTTLAIPVKVFGLPGSSDDSGAFCAAFGLACGQFKPREDQFDFLYPKRAVDPQAVKARQIRVAVAAVAAVFVLGLLYSHNQVAAKEREYLRLVEQRRKLEDQKKEFDKFALQMGQIQTWADHKINWLDQLQALTEMIPNTTNLYVNHVLMVEGTKAGIIANLDVGGLAKSRSAIDKLYQDLNARYKVEPGQGGQTSDPQYPETFKIALAARPVKPAAATTTKPVPSPSPSLRPASLPAERPLGPRPGNHRFINEGKH